jgi:integrase
VLPIHPKVKTIIEKYQSNTDSPFPVFFKGEQKFNVHLKEVARIVGGPFSQSVIKRISRAGKKQEIVIPKSELMCSHVARRTCATNLSKAGIPITVIQKITGHKSLRSLSIYLKQSQTDAADMLQQFWNKQDSNSHTAVNTSTVTATIG